MIEIKLGVLLNQNFMKVTDKIYNHEYDSAKSGFNVLKLYDKISDEVKTADKLREKIILKYAKVDDDGNPIIKNNQYDILDGKMPELNEKFNELSETTTVIDNEKVNLSDLDGLKFNLGELKLIESIVDTEK